MNAASLLESPAVILADLSSLPELHCCVDYQWLTVALGLNKQPAQKPGMCEIVLSVKQEFDPR